MSKNIPEGAMQRPTLKEFREKADSRPFTKEHVTVKSEGSKSSGKVGGVRKPTAEELAKINKYTTFVATDDDVVVFDTYSANDIIDRSDERFPAEFLRAVVDLEPMRSPLGKSFMADHGRSIKDIKGRIFDARIEVEDGVTHLVNSVYVPKTTQHESFIENVRFGLNWAVSVGLRAGNTTCSICDSKMASLFGWTWCLDKGHEKGLYYDPNEEIEDGDEATPVSPDDQNAVMCVREYQDPRDFIELSSVYLGALYGAEIGKNAEIDGVLKVAGAAGITEYESRDIQFPHANARLQKALREFSDNVKQDASGNFWWTDNAGVKWLSIDNEVMCMGTKNDTATEAEVNGEAEVTNVESAPEGEVVAYAVDANAADKAVAPSINFVAESVKAGLPTDVIAKIGDQVNPDVASVLKAVADVIAERDEKIVSMKEMSDCGQVYVADLRKAARASYQKLHNLPDDSPELIKYDKIIASVGSDIEAIKFLDKSNTDLFESQMPAVQVRRSSFDSDPNYGEFTAEPFVENPMIQSLHG